MSRQYLVAVFVVLAVVAIGVMWKQSRSGFTVVAPKRSLYDRLGGAFPIAAVVDRFSDEILKSPLVGVDSPNPALRQWSRKQASARLPGLKFMRTLWVADVAGGPQHYSGTKPGPTRLNLSAAHRHLNITSQEFDEVARILGATLDSFNVPTKERAEVLGAFAAHKGDIVGKGARQAFTPYTLSRNPPYDIGPDRYSARTSEDPPELIFPDEDPVARQTFTPQYSVNVNSDEPRWSDPRWGDPLFAMSDMSGRGRQSFCPYPSQLADRESAMNCPMVA
jgi:hemoglobin